MRNQEKRQEYLKKYRSIPGNKEKQKIRAREWARANHSKVVKSKQSTKEKDPYRFNELQRECARRYCLKFPERHRLSSKNSQRVKRRLCLEHYGNKCKCCGEDKWEFLALDHIEGGGTEHRKSQGNIANWAIKNNYPPILQILCHNCNQAKGYYGYCPHDVSSQSH